MPLRTAKPTRVLVIEADNELARRQLETLGMNPDHSVVVVTSIEEAKKTIKAGGTFDLILRNGQTCTPDQVPSLYF